MIVAGIMTGTSLDGVDVAICEIEKKGDHAVVTLLSYKAAPYNPDVKYLVNRALNSKASMEELSDLPFLLAESFASAIDDVKRRYDGPAIEAIAVHGQTVWHNPPHSTWQMVSGPALSALTKLPVVHDFRSADIALGGQGAPLVPIYDHYVMRDDSVDRVALNLGGMANVTLLPAGGSLDDLMAFDTGPGNVLIDSICVKAFGKRFDNEGMMAREGAVIESALEQIKSLPYFSLDPPKSTGRELFGEDFANDLYRQYANPSVPAEDLLATLTELTAWSVADHISRYLPSAKEVIVSGGGTHNSFLLQRLDELVQGARIRSSIEIGVDPDAKEAMCFALLGFLTLNHIPGNVPSVTGATSPVVLGSVVRSG